MKKRKFINRTLALLLLIALSLSIQIPQTQTVQAANSTKFNAKTAKKNLTVKYYKLADGILLICKNKNSYPVKLEGAVTFLDADKQELSVSKDQNNCLGAKQTCALFYKAPLDSNSNYLMYHSYKKSLKVSKCTYKSYSKKIKTAVNVQPNVFNLSVMNNGTKKLDMIRVSCVIYDSTGAITGYVQKYVTCYEKGSSVLETISYPAACKSHSKIKVYVDTAYKY